MNADAFRFEIEPTVLMEEAEMSLHLALLAVEGLYGQARVRLEATYDIHTDKRVIVVDGGSEVRAALVKIYTGLLIREFGEGAFNVHRKGECASGREQECGA